MSLADLEPYEASSGPSEELGRTPPQDVAAEMSVLGGMMLSKDAIADVVEQIRGTDFYRPAHELVYDAIMDLYGRGEPADAITVAATLTRKGEIGRVGGQGYLHTLISSVPTAANAGYYARIVRERAVLRRLVEAGTRIVQLGYAAEGGDVDALVNNAQAEVYAVTERRTTEDYVPLGSTIEATIDEIEASSHRGDGMIGVPTGFSDLDALTNGLHPGQMIVIAARPAIGKSTIGLDILRSASIKAGMTSVVFSLEMSKTEITMRLLSAEARIPLQNMRKGTMREEDWTRLAKTMGAVSEAPLFIDDSPNMTLMEIRAKCRRLKQRHDLKLVVIDYLQLMTSGKRVESRQQEVSEFSRALKLLAKELEVPVIAISQLNRGPEQRTDKRPAMSDLRESGCLTADTRLLRADTGAEVSLGELMAAGARDVPVWALNERLQLVPRTLTHAFPSGVRQAYRMVLASGREVTATANHPFLTFDGWRPLGELAPGDRLGVVRHVPPPLAVTAWDDDEVVLLAHMLGAGSAGAHRPIRYASIDEENLAAVCDAARRRFGVTAVRDGHPDARVTTLRLPAPHRLARGRRNPVAAWLDGLGLLDGLGPLHGRSQERSVPDGVHGLPKAQVALFLRHLWATDGCVQWDPEHGLARIHFASAGRRLADDVCRLLARLNIVGRVATTSGPGHRTRHQVVVEGSADQKRFLDDVGVHGARGGAAATVRAELEPVGVRVRRDLTARGREQLRRAMLLHAPGEPVRVREVVGAATPLSGVVRVLDEEQLDIVATNDVLWDDVRSITPVGEVDVYDATVMGLHNFVANGINAKNSIEQDADMVILLHREDAYERESPRAGEADLIVAKHRNGPTDTIVVAFQGHYSRFVDMAAG